MTQSEAKAYAEELGIVHNNLDLFISTIYEYHRKQFLAKSRWGMSMRDSAHKFNNELTQLKQQIKDKQ